jgi:chemotaxis protein CheD
MAKMSDYKLLWVNPDANEQTKDTAPSAHYLHPGAIFASPTPCIVTTVLGTCVSVCLWDRVRRVGGINHFMLPRSTHPSSSSAKFGDIAIPELINRMERLNCSRANLVAKVFGGKSQDTELSPLNVGARNSDLAEEALDAASIQIVAHDLAGPFGLKLLFHTWTGEAFVKRLVNR